MICPLLVQAAETSWRWVSRWFPAKRRPRSPIDPHQGSTGRWRTWCLLLEEIMDMCTTYIYIYKYTIKNKHVYRYICVCTIIYTYITVIWCSKNVTRECKSCTMFLFLEELPVLQTCYAGTTEPEPCPRTRPAQHHGVFAESGGSKRRTFQRWRLQPRSGPRA